MKKIKFLIASMLGAIALVFACVLGTKVNAKGNTAITNTYTLDSADELPAVKKNGGTGTGTSTATSGDTLSVTITNNFTNDISAYSSGYIKRASTDSSKYVSFRFDARGAGSIKLSSFTTQSDKKYATITLYSVDSNDVLTSISSERIAVKGVDKSYSYASSGTYDLRIYGDESQASNISCSSIVITETYSKALYNVNYNANGHGNAPSTVENVASLSNSILAPMDSDSSYTFKNWYFDADCTDLATSSSDLGAKDTDNDYEVTLYAKWETKSSYLINFYVDSELYDEEEVAFSGDGKLTSWPTAPSRVGYQFDGWYNGDVKVDADTVFTADTTLNARFSLKVMAKGQTYSLNYADYCVVNEVIGQYNGKLTDSADYFEQDFFTFKDSSTAVTADGSAFKFSNTGSTSNNYISLVIPSKSIAKITLGNIRTTASDNTATSFGLSDGTSVTTISTVINTVGDDFVYNYVNSSDDVKTLYLYRTGSKNAKINTITVSVVDYETAKIGDFASATVFAEKNTAGDTLRFVGKITGVEDLANIESIELILTKGGVATKSQIFLTSCYTSVVNASRTCSSADGTYYVIFRLTGVSGLTASFTKQLKVTFTDGSTAISNVGNFELK